MSAPLLLPHFRYRALVGVGGIGSGHFFSVDGDKTLGREESRSGRLLRQRDYCKLHIITHYVSTLLGKTFATLALGKVGDDEIGRRLLQEMEDADIDTHFVEVSKAPTLFSFCIIYPDGSGGNLTTNDSASADVDDKLIQKAANQFRHYAGSGIALAVPEVPVAARWALLRMATAHSFFRVASFTSDEIASAVEEGILSEVDLLSINRDEAAAIGLADPSSSLHLVVERTINHLSQEYPALQVIITAGLEGSWSWDGKQLHHVPALLVASKNAAGAGDAYLAGTIAGLTASRPLLEAQRLGNIVAALSTTSPHTIHPEIDRLTLRNFIAESGAQIDIELKSLLGIEQEKQT